MKLKPLADRVVLRQNAAEERTSTGIFLTASAQEKPEVYEVVEVGPGGMVDGNEVKMIVKPGENGVSPEYDTDDHSTCVLRFKDNVTATLVSSCYSRDVRPNCGYVITLEDMIIDYRLRNNIIFTDAHKTVDIKRGHEQTDDLDRAFIDAIKTGDRSLIRSPYADAVRTLEFVLACNESMATGKAVSC